MPKVPVRSASKLSITFTNSEDIYKAVTGCLARSKRQTSRRSEQRMPAMVLAFVAVTPDSLKPASLATATSCWAVAISRHSTAKMNGSNLKISFDPASNLPLSTLCLYRCSAAIEAGEQDHKAEGLIDHI